MLFWGIVFLVPPFFVLRALFRRDKALRKERFDRTNSSGVAEFRDFEEASSFERKEALNMFLLKAVGGVCFFAMLFGALLVLVWIFGRHR